MANIPKISSGHSVSVAPSNPDSPNPHPETKLNPPFSSPLGHTFPPPPIHSNQIPSPSIMIPSPNVVTHPYQMPSPSVRTPSPNSVTQPNQIRSPSVRTPSPNSVVQPNQMSSPSVRTPSPSSSSVSPSNGIRDGRPVPHLSTPPAAPRFSSPIQTPVVPYRTSHPKPQSLAFSSGSNLPMSSPPQCSNGSIELQHQVSDASEDLFPVTESTNVLFSANKVLKQKKLVNTPSLGFGALVSPGREISLGPQIIQRDPHRCQNCGAYANFYCNILIGSGQWQCVICRNLNGSEGEYIASSKEELRTLPELSSPFVDYIQTGDKRPGFVPVSDYGVSAPVVLVIDECLDEPHLQHLQSSLHAFVDSLQPTTRIGIVLYGRTVSVYDFSEESTASADVLPGKISPSRESLKSLIYGTGLYISPLHASRSAAHSIFSSLRSYKLNSPETSRDRCLGTAVEVALAIIKGPSSQLPRGVMRRSGGISRIIVCAGGPNTHGPGSVPHSLSHPNYPYMEKAALKWMENLGHEAHRHNTVVDILCAGTCPVRVPIVQSLAKACGGVLILHDDFGEAFGVNLQRASTRAAGSHGLLEVRCSDNISVTQVIGPGEEGNADNHEYFKNDSSLSIQMLSVEQMQCFALSMETRSDIKSDYVYFQFAIQYSNMYHADVSRVITVRLPTVDSVSAYLETIQDEVAAVIIAKRTLLRAKDSSTANDMQATIDERIKDIASKFGSHTPRSKLYRFPKELAYLPEFLFHLRRGPLLGNIIGHEDERSVLRSLFLNASLDISIRMVAPRCLMHREGGTFEEVPAHDLAMQSDSAVVLDHGTDIFIWLGAELASQSGQSAAALAACRTLAEELAEMRFPAPRILAFKEGSSQARYFVSRLIPAHKDPPYEQEARFPQLRTLSPEQRTKLKSSFIHFDEPSFCEWMRGLKVSPPEPS